MPGTCSARVIVNRLWAEHFGRGLVHTVSDFGIRGEPPTHPELLDFLATELIRNGWKLKPIHKLIVTSDAYKQSSTRDEAKAKLDPENKLVWRQPVRRLQAEVIRDSILAVGGRLNTTMYGPGTLSEESPAPEHLLHDEAEQTDSFPCGVRRARRDNQRRRPAEYHGPPHKRCT